MRKLWNLARELEWFAIIAVALMATAIALVLFTTLWELPVILGMAAVVSAIFSHRI